MNADKTPEDQAPLAATDAKQAESQTPRRDRHLIFLLVAVGVAALLLAGILISKFSGGDSTTLSAKTLRHRLDVQFTLEGGAGTKQAQLLRDTLPGEALVACWNEGTDRVCAAAVPEGAEYGFIQSLDRWTFYRATFEVGSTEPDIDEVDPEDALNPQVRSPEA